jgi:hypothetical protein
MIDFSVDINDLVAQLERDSTVSIEEKKQILEVLNDETDDEQLSIKMEVLAKDFLGEDSTTQEEWALVSGGDRGSFVDEYKKQIYKQICTESEEYKEDRLSLSSHSKSLLQIAISIATTTYSVSLAVVSATIYCILIPILKLGKNAYCSMHHVS